MKLRFTVEFDIENDWDAPIFSDGGVGRKRVVADALRRDTMSAVLSTLPRRMIDNGITIRGFTISDPEWEGWDNARIAQELESQT